MIKKSIIEKYPSKSLLSVTHFRNSKLLGSFYRRRTKFAETSLETLNVSELISLKDTNRRDT